MGNPRHFLIKRPESKKDQFEFYQEHGVREYRIANPNNENMTVF